MTADGDGQAGGAASKPTLPRSFHGVWSLTKWEMFRNGELDAYPHGADGKGQLQLTSQGGLSAFFQRTDWAASDPGERPTRDRFIAYAGKWRVENDVLLYEIAYASNPRWIGQTFQRIPSVKRGVLVLETPEKINSRGERIVGRSSWTKGA